MNSEQANNLKILIRHMDGLKRKLNMDQVFDSCKTPACAMGECTVIPELEISEAEAKQITLGGWSPIAAVKFGADSTRVRDLFAARVCNPWKRNDVTPQEWAAEARKVLAEHGHTCDDAFNRFLAKVQEPSLTDAERSEAALAGVLDKVR